MNSILVISASPYGHRSRGTAMAMEIVCNLQARHPELTLVTRDLSTLANNAVHAGFADAIVHRHPDDAEAFGLSEELICELEMAAFVIIATPVHNYAVPARFKTWIDLVLRYGRSFVSIDGVKTGTLKDRPTLVIVTSGGFMTGAKRAQPDHITGYLQDVIRTIGIESLQFLYLDGLADPGRVEHVLADGRATIGNDPVFGDPVSIDS